MIHLQSLNGAWELIQSGYDTVIPATVPGCVHTDLLAAGKIEDPFYRDNELHTLWVGETDWTYRRAFTVPLDMLAHERVLLRCEGLDTVATITLNGVTLGHTENMYRTWEFDVKSILTAGENTIQITFASAMEYVREREARGGVLPAWGVGQHKLNSGSWIRKQPSNFGWDWGPMLVTCGIWRDITLIAFDTARLTDVLVLQNHSQPGQVGLSVRVQAEVTGTAALTARCRASIDGEAVAEASAPLSAGSGEIALTIHNPRLWWPNGMGSQPLYTVAVELVGPDGALLDQDEKRIGLRTLNLDRHDDEWGETFQFAVNGTPFFAKGGNWIPADTFVTRLTPDDYRRLLEDSAAANLNMIRVWGGGIYEADAFYDICDELGLCVWQDFIFACATYPGFDQDFLADVKHEAEDNVQRLRHHASLALWCGNNELEQGLVGSKWTARTMSWEDYGAIFDTLLPEAVHRLDPQRDYWPGSPHTPRGDRSYWQSPEAGDTHLWSVWHGKEPFEWYRDTFHRFVSEFGFQSFPEPHTTYTYTLPEDRNLTSYVMEHHQRSGNGNALIVHYMTDWFQLPSSFEMWLWLSQILQGLGIKYAVEHWRAHMPRTMGALYWQINDCWPVASWSSIDYFGRWKALHYMAKRFYAPLLITGQEDETGAVTVLVTSDLHTDQSGDVIWTLTDVEGNVLARDTFGVSLGANQSQRVNTLNLAPYLASHGARNLLLFLDLKVNGEIVSSNFVSFARPKHLMLHEPGFDIQVDTVENGRFRVTLQAERPALWAWLTLADGDARFSDNFFHMRAGQPVQVMASAPGMTLDAFQKNLRVYSLIDTYRP